MITREPKIVQKKWGQERHHTNDAYCLKDMIVSRGCRCSIHHHKIKDETFIVTGGVPLFVSFGPDPGFAAMQHDVLFPGESIRIKPNVWHTFAALDISRLNTPAAAIVAATRKDKTPIQYTDLVEMCQGSARFIESSTHDSPEDSYRYDESTERISDADNLYLWGLLVDAWSEICAGRES